MPVCTTKSSLGSAAAAVCGCRRCLPGWEKLFCEYDQQVKHYPEKHGIVHNEILLPENAPPEYADRNILWNAAEAVEKQWNSQIARGGRCLPSMPPFAGTQFPCPCVFP